MALGCFQKFFVVAKYGDLPHLSTGILCCGCCGSASIELPSSLFGGSPPELPNASIFLRAEPNPTALSSGARSEATEESSAREGRVLEILACLREQALFWIPWGRRSGPWAFFVLSNNEPILLDKPQVLRCLLGHSNALGADMLALKTRGRKGLITFNKAHGTNVMRKHMEHEHGEMSSRFYRDIAECRAPPIT